MKKIEEMDYEKRTRLLAIICLITGIGLFFINKILKIAISSFEMNDIGNAVVVIVRNVIGIMSVACCLTSIKILNSKSDKEKEKTK